MSTIKGQNLRIIIDGQCVAAATGCTLHLAAQVEDSSTKDSDSDWAEQEVTGFSWDASVDALVVDTEFRTGTADAQTPSGMPDLQYVSSVGFNVKKGQRIRLTGNLCQVGLLKDAYMATGGASDFEELAMAYRTLHHTFEQDMKIFIAAERPGSVEYSIEEEPTKTCVERITEAMEARESVGVRLSLTGGFNNRFEEKTLLEGKALISDFQINAANRQNGTYTAQLTGTGPLETASPAAVLLPADSAPAITAGPEPQDETAAPEPQDETADE